MVKIKFFSKKFLKAPAFITMFLLAFILISFGAKSLIAALTSNGANTNNCSVKLPTNLEGISENGIQYAVAKKSTQLIGAHENYGNWQPTAGFNSINIENGDKIKFLINFDEGYSNLKISDIKLLDSGLKDAPFSLKVYDYDNSGTLVERDPKENETIIPGKNYPTSEFTVNKNLNLSFSGIKKDNYHINISIENDAKKAKDLIDVYYYFSNESEKKKMNFSENSNSYELNGLNYNSGINLIIERSAPYTQTKLNLEDIEGIDEFINKSQTDAGVKINTAVNKNYDIKIAKTAEKNTYNIKNNTSGTLEYKLSSENEYKTLENGNSFSATHGENYEFKYENLEKTLISNNTILQKNDYIYSLYNISENIELSSKEELSETNVPIYLPAQENGILIVDENGKNQLKNSNVKYGSTFSFRLKQVEGYTQYFNNIEVYKNNVLESDKILLTANNENTKDECSGLYTITDIRQPIKIETSKPMKNIYEVSVAQNLKNAKIEVSGENIKLDENTQNLGTKVYDVEDKGDLEITVTPNSGYNTNNMTLDVDADASPNVSLENNKFTVSSIKSDTTLSVRNIQETITVSFSSGMDYTDSSNTSQTINKGESFSFRLKDNLKDENFIVKANNTQLTKDFDGNYTIFNIKENQSITVEPDKSKNITVTIDKNKIPDDTSISYKVNGNQSGYQDIKNVDSLEVPVDSSITFQKNGNDDTKLSIKSGSGENVQTFDANNQYTVSNIISPLTVSPLRGPTNNVDDGLIHAWSLAKTYKIGKPSDEENQIQDYEINFNNDNPTDIKGSTATNDTYNVQFKRQDKATSYDSTTCQGLSSTTNELYFGPTKLNINLKYGNINNEKNFLGFKVDGKRNYVTPLGYNAFTVDKDIFGIRDKGNKGAITNNIGMGANNSSQNTCQIQSSGTFSSQSFNPRYEPYLGSVTRYFVTPRVFQKENNSFATMFELDNGTIQRVYNMNSYPLSTRTIISEETLHELPWGCQQLPSSPPSPRTLFLQTGSHSFFNNTLLLNLSRIFNGPLPDDDEWGYPYGTVDFDSLFISQNLNFDRSKHDQQGLVDGNLEYNIQSKYVNNINGRSRSHYSMYSFDYWPPSDVCEYNAMLFNNIYPKDLSFRQLTDEQNFEFNNNWYRMQSFDYYFPNSGTVDGTTTGSDTRYFGSNIRTPDVTEPGSPGNVGQTSSFDLNGAHEEEGIRFLYLYDEITLTPMFKNADYASEATIEMPLDTEGLEFYEAFDNNGKIQKSSPMHQNRYTVRPEGDNLSAEFNFIVKPQKGYDFNENSVKAYPEGYAQIIHNGEEDTFIDEDGEVCYIYKVRKIYSNDIKISIPDLEKHEYTLKCNLYSSNFYDASDGEKFLTKKVKSGDDFTFETEAQNGYTIDSETLTVSYGGNEIVISEAGTYTLSGGTIITRETTSQSLKNKYKIENLSSDLTLTSNRKKRKLDITFMCNDEAFVYKDTDGKELKQKITEAINPEGIDPPPAQGPTDRPFLGDNYFIIDRDYGTNLNFMIETTTGYDSTTLVATANGSPIEYVNGQYKVKTITENIIIKVESIEKIKCKLVFTQHEGIKFKDTKDNVLPSENELRYNDSFTFKTELSDSYSPSGHTLKIEYASGNIEDMTPSETNPNIFTVKDLKENCRIYIVGLDYKKHDIKLYKSEGITFKDKYGNSDLESISSDNTFITQQALHGQSFSFKVVANEGYDISGMKLFAKKEATGTRQQLFPSNNVYTIENITEDYTVTLEKVEKTQYSVEIRLTDGVKCVDKNGDTMKTNLTVLHGDDVSFYLSLDGAYSKASPTVTVKGVLNPILPDASGKYTISNIKENKIVEISGVKKNTYKATFVGAEGVIYKNNKNKPFENSLDVEYGESLYFKITLMDAYDKSTPLVMMNDNKVIAESAGVYTVTNINSDITISVKNVTKNPEEVTMDDVNDVPNPVITNDDVDSVVKATLTYENLSDEEKAQVTNLAALQKAQKEAGELNHKSGNIYVNGLDWNIKVIATELTKDEEKVNYLNSKIDRRELINLYDIYLLNVLTGKTYELPYGQSVDVTMPAPPSLTGYQNTVIAHEKSSGNIEYLDVNITDNTVKFTATSFSLFGLAAKKTPNYSESPSSTHISVSGLVENEEELKTLFGEGVVSQIGDLTQPDNSLTSSENQDGSSDNGSIPMSWWQKFYKWALNHEFLIVLLILLLGAGTIWILLLLDKRRRESE